MLCAFKQHVYKELYEAWEGDVTCRAEEGITEVGKEW